MQDHEKGGKCLWIQSIRKLLCFCEISYQSFQDWGPTVTEYYIMAVINFKVNSDKKSFKLAYRYKKKNHNWLS